MRVCFLTHYFPPEVGAPQTRISLLARTLSAHGFDVAVHTGFPHYPDGGVKAPYRNRPYLVERRDGVQIVRSAVYPAANAGFARRLLDHAALGASALLSARLSGPADVVVAESPPLFTAAAGVLYARAKRAALIVNIADLWPASAIEMGALSDRRAIALAESLERWIYRHATRLTSPTAGIVDALEQMPEAAGKARRLWPVVDLARFDAAPAPARDGAALEILYAGTVGLAHGLEVLVEACRLSGPEVVRARIAGGGADAERIGALIAERGISNVEMLGVLGAQEIPRLYAQSDAAVVMLRDLPIFHGALPTKLLEAMAAGRPVLLSARGEAPRLIEEAGAGVVVEPEDPAALAEAIRRLQGDPQLRRSLGAAGRAHVEAHFGAGRAAERWAEVLRDAAAAAGAGAGAGGS